MIKTVHLITGLSVGGSEMTLYKLVKQMDRTRFSNVVVSMTGIGAVGELIEQAGIKVIYLGMKRGFVNPLGFYRLIRILRRERPDVLQTWLYHSDFLGLIASRLTGSFPLLWNLRCSKMDPADHSVILSTIIKILAKYSGSPEVIVTNSEAGKKAHEIMGYKAKRWELIPNGIATEKFRPSPSAKKAFKDSLSLSDDSLLVGHIARLHPMKDHSTFLKAAAIVAKKMPDVYFVMVGNGVEYDNAELRKNVNDSGLGGRVFMLGEREDIEQINAALDLLVSSSAYGEGFSNAIAEAMASKVPCVATDVGDSAMIIEDTGIVVPPGDPQAIAAGMTKILSMSAEERGKLGDKARERIVNNFSIDKSIKRYENLYEQVYSK